MDIFLQYENTPVQYKAIFHGCKNENFQLNFFILFSYFCSKHILWVHVRTASLRKEMFEFTQLSFVSSHYENMPMQFFAAVKNIIFR